MDRGVNCIVYCKCIIVNLIIAGNILPPIPEQYSPSIVQFNNNVHVSSLSYCCTSVTSHLYSNYIMMNDDIHITCTTIQILNTTFDMRILSFWCLF